MSAASCRHSRRSQHSLDYLGAQAAFRSSATLSDKIFAPFWPPNIVLLCALLLSPYRRWWLGHSCGLSGHVIAEIGMGMHAPQLMVAFMGNVMVADRARRRCGIGEASPLVLQHADTCLCLKC